MYIASREPHPPTIPMSTICCSMIYTATSRQRLHAVLCGHTLRRTLIPVVSCDLTDVILKSELGEARPQQAGRVLAPTIKA